MICSFEVYVFLALQAMCSFEGNLTISTSAKHPFGRCFPGVSFGGVPVIRFSMLGDVADLLQLQTDGKKDEGPIRDHG